MIFQNAGAVFNEFWRYLKPMINDCDGGLVHLNGLNESFGDVLIWQIRYRDSKQNIKIADRSLL